VVSDAFTEESEELGETKVEDAESVVVSPPVLEMVGVSSLDSRVANEEVFCVEPEVPIDVPEEAVSTCVTLLVDKAAEFVSVWVEVVFKIVSDNVAEVSVDVPDETVESAPEEMDLGVSVSVLTASPDSVVGVVVAGLPGDTVTWLDN
jgi:hypothetical protein